MSIETFQPTEAERRLADAVNELVAACHNAAVSAGWYTNLETGERLKRNVPEMIALEHSELSEALESLRKNTMDDKLTHRLGHEVETADALIRMFDRAGYLGYDLGGAIIEKMHFNRNRADHKIENRKMEGGKKI